MEVIKKIEEKERKENFFHFHRRTISDRWFQRDPQCHNIEISLLNSPNRATSNEEKYVHVVTESVPQTVPPLPYWTVPAFPFRQHRNSPPNSKNPKDSPRRQSRPLSWRTWETVRPVLSSLPRRCTDDLWLTPVILLEDLGWTVRLGRSTSRRTTGFSSAFPWKTNAEFRQETRRGRALITRTFDWNS